MPKGWQLQCSYVFFYRESQAHFDMGLNCSSSGSPWHPQSVLPHHILNWMTSPQSHFFIVQHWNIYIAISSSIAWMILAFISMTHPMRCCLQQKALGKRIILPPLPPSSCPHHKPISSSAFHLVPDLSFCEKTTHLVLNSGYQQLEHALGGHIKI